MKIGSTVMIRVRRTKDLIRRKLGGVVGVGRAAAKAGDVERAAGRAAGRAVARAVVGKGMCRTKAQQVKKWIQSSQHQARVPNISVMMKLKRRQCQRR